MGKICIGARLEECVTILSSYQTIFTEGEREGDGEGEHDESREDEHEERGADA